MKGKLFLVGIAVLVAIILLALVGRLGKVEQALANEGITVMAPPEWQRDPHNHGFNADQESWMLNGHDIIGYSGNKTGEMYRIDAMQGAITMTGNLLISTGSLSVGGNLSGNGLALNGDLTMTHGAIFNTHGSVTVTDNLDVTGDFYMNSGGEIIQRSGGVTITDDLELAGDFSMNAGGRIIQRNGAVTVSDELSVVGGLYAEGSAYVAYDAYIDRWLNLDDRATITVTSWLTPSLTGSFSPIASAAWATPTVASGCVPGDFWVIENWGSFNICLADGSNLYLAGSVDWTGGQHDTLMLICDPGGNWIELGRSDN